MTATFTEFAAPPTAGRCDDIHHVACCDDDDLALCGQDVSGQPWVARAQISCAVCVDLDKHGCAVVCPKLMRSAQ